MAILQKRKILYFTTDMVPTDADVAAAAAIGHGVVFRNAAFVDEKPFEGQIEKCDAVAGHAPAAYRSRFEYIGQEPAKTELVKTETETPPAASPEFTGTVVPPQPETAPAEPTPPAAPAAPEVPPAAPAAPAAPQPANDGWATTPPAPPAA